MKLDSLRRRMLAGVVGAELVLAAGLVWAGIAFTYRQLRQAFDTALAGQTTAVAALVRYPEVGPGLRFDANLVPPPAQPSHPPLYRVRGPGGIIAGTFPAGVVLPPPAARPRYWNFRYRGAGYRGLVLAHLPVLDTEEHLPMPLPQLTVFYAAPTAVITHATIAAGAAIAAISLALLALTTWLAAGVIGRELAPLRELAAQAAAISPHNWSFTPPVRAAAAELQPLIAALQRMLERLQAAHRQQRDFLADTAHHLKTPVALIKSTQQTLLQRPRAISEYRTAAEATLQDTERLEHLLQRMLRLARLDAAAEAPASAPVPPADAGATVAAALERTRPLAAARRVGLRAQGAEVRARVRIEAEDLEQVWVNLLENSIQHSPPGSAVEVECANGAGGLRVAVRDQGSGIAAEDLPGIFERFRRGQESRGAGLGLAIARAIVESGGGTIAAESSPAGTIMKVLLPHAEAKRQLP
ncbi:MAG: ATP-binding protein [Terriglobales bacterium]